MQLSSASCPSRRARGNRRSSWRRSRPFTAPASSTLPFRPYRQYDESRNLEIRFMPFSLKGHVALVTGSSTGLGKAVALELGKAGAKVVVNYFNNVARAEKTF